MQTKEITAKFDELLEITRASFETFVKTTVDVMRERRPLPLAVDEENAPAEQLQMDMALLAAAPVAAVPLHAPFHSLQENGHRFLLAQDGLYLEVRRPWLHFIHRLEEHTAVRIPYGSLTPKVELAFGTIGSALPQMKEFAARAIEAAPIEAAARLIWNTQECSWSIRYPETIGEASSAHIQFREVILEENESIAIDLHSHGFGHAFFSGTDDADDSGSVKIAGVFGNLDQPRPTVAFRLCVLGLYLPINVPAEKIFG